MKIEHELCSKDATELRLLIDSREVSCVEVLDAHLQQIESQNPSLNAIVTLVPEMARERATQLDKQLQRGENPGILTGLPIAHKDLVPTKDIRTTFGSRIYEHHVPTSNALIVDRIQDAGAVTLGKTNTPEWGAGSQTFNEVFGATHNPYDLDKTCGGSSGGAATALASRMLPIADGGDFGGSLRNPANFCNVVGFRVSAGRVPTVDQNGWFSLAVLGPMARTVSDCAMLLSAIAGPDTRAPLSLPTPGSAFSGSLLRDFKDARIALSPDFGGQIPVNADVRKVVSSSASTFTDLGCRVEDYCADFSGADATFKTLRAWSFASRHGDLIVQQPDLFKESIHWNVAQGKKLTGTDIYQAEVTRTEIFRRFSEVMLQYDFLVLPVSQVAPFDINTEWVTEIDGVSMDTYIDWMKSCYLVSVTGLPSISVPCGFNDQGLPIGIQIVGGHGQDLAVLQLAYAFEQATRTYQRMPGTTES